jgi:hypothetical protein
MLSGVGVHLSAIPYPDVLFEKNPAEHDTLCEAWCTTFSIEVRRNAHAGASASGAQWSD